MPKYGTLPGYEQKASMGGPPLLRLLGPRYLSGNRMTA